MRSVTAIILLDSVKSTSTFLSITKVDKLLDRAIKALAIRHVDLDHMFGKHNSLPMPRSCLSTLSAFPSSFFRTSWLHPQLPQRNQFQTIHSLRREYPDSLMARPLVSWEEIESASSRWASPRQAHEDDVPLILYRDANAWCPFCHRVWYFMEEKGLRYTTEKIHLRGDPAEPPKQNWYKAMVPSGAVPAVRIRDEVVPESLDILWRLEKEFPEPRLVPPGEEAYIQSIAQVSGAFNTDASDFLHNTRPEFEDVLRAETMQRFKWLEGVLAKRGGPFFLGKDVSLLDAAFVGFLTRQAHNLLFFKCIDLRDGVSFPQLTAWFNAMEQRPAYNSIKQDAYFEQMIYQAHPDRRAGAEYCMQLGPVGSRVGEPDCSKQPAPPSAELDPGSMHALEAAWTLQARRQPVAHFLLRKKTQMDNADVVEDQAAAENGLRAVAAVLSGLMAPGEAVAALGCVDSFKRSSVSRLGCLIGTPRDMSSGAAAQVRGALQAMISSGVHDDGDHVDSRSHNVNGSSKAPPLQNQGAHTGLSVLESCNNATEYFIIGIFALPSFMLALIGFKRFCSFPKAGQEPLIQK